jgi:uncharacterized membrane-anchored protein
MKKDEYELQILLNSFIIGIITLIGVIAFFTSNRIELLGLTTAICVLLIGMNQAYFIRLMKVRNNERR